MPRPTGPEDACLVKVRPWEDDRLGQPTTARILTLYRLPGPSSLPVWAADRWGGHTAGGSLRFPRDLFPGVAPA